MVRPLVACLLLLLLLATAGCDDRRVASDAGAPPVDAATVDAGLGRDASAPPADGGGPGDDAGGPPADAGAPIAAIGLTFGGGCAPDFSGDVVVVRNASSIAVSSTRGGALTGSLQLGLEDPLGPVSLSSQHRVDSGSVINVIVGTTWTNLARDSAGVLAGTVPDPIGGTLTVRAYDESSGVVDIDFGGVTLQNPSDGSLCTIDGRLQTFGLSF